MNQKKILDLGCGSRKTNGAIGVDQCPLPGVDIVHDLNAYPYPLEDNQFDEIHLCHIVEHIDHVERFMQEVHRVGKPGALVLIDTPHYTSCNSYKDPSHKHHFSLLTFETFCGDTEHPYLYKEKFEQVTSHVRFWPFNDKIQWLSFATFGMGGGVAKYHPSFFERFLAFLFPIKDFQIQLKIIK